ncbi:hypothetical protein BHM03_00060902, partial [Ensete ventricosum]
MISPRKNQPPRNGEGDSGHDDTVDTRSSCAFLRLSLSSEAAVTASAESNTVCNQREEERKEETSLQRFYLDSAVVKQQQVQEPHGEEKNHQSQQQHQEDDIHKHGKHGVRSDPMEKVKLGSSGEGWRWKRIERDREDDGGNSNVIGNPANKVSTSFGWIRRGDVDALWRDRWAPTR